MLPAPSNVRSRYKQQSNDVGMAKLETALHDSALRYKMLPTRIKIILGMSLLGSALFYGFIVHRSVFKNDLTNEAFLETDKCPACYGSSACSMLFYDRVTMKGFSRIRFLDFTSVKNVHFANSEDLGSVVLKKLASPKELQKVDDQICSDGNRLSGCDVARVIYITNIGETIKNVPIQPKFLEQSVGMFTCSSYRLLDRFWKYSKERTKKDDIFFRDKLQLWYTATVNTEPLMLQTFPASEGWPFPEYHGACGRFIVVEDSGKTLHDFYNAPFEKRADIAYQIMKMAEKLTTNDDKFALYWTDLQYENLAVDVSGKVKFIDVENFVVVDLMAIEATKPKDWDTFHQSDFDDCSGRNCLSFSTDELCSRIQSDHNYYAACRNILSQYANEDGKPNGLLHDMPQHAVEYWDLHNLLNECARPHVVQGRLQAKEKIIAALDNLRFSSPNLNALDDNGKEEHEKGYWKKLKGKKDKELDE